MQHIEKLELIRQQMTAKEIDALIIPSADPHISEYLPERYKCIAWTSGFTGSAGTLVITADFAGLWTDSRYFVQANEQLQGTGFELVKLKAQGSPEYTAWLAEHLPANAKVAYDGNLMSRGLAAIIQQDLEPLGMTIDTEADLLSPIWTDRPALPMSPAYLISENLTGETTIEKLDRLRAEMSRLRTDWHLISSLDDIAWLFNIRGSDVSCNPVVLSFALVSKDRMQLFIHKPKLTEQDAQRLIFEGIDILSYEEALKAIAEIPAGSRILIDPKRTCQQYYAAIPGGVSIIEDTNPTTHFKSVKNDTEIANTRDAMIKDGVALTYFFKWIEDNLGKETITEISLAQKAAEFRALQTGFIGESFDTIAGYTAHGALPHYKATDSSNSTLEATGLLLVDSGGQYLTGTTDITRVISLGDIQPEEQIDYTLVLKGMIEGSSTQFPQGTRGYQIDAITRKPLWDHLRNYGHGTGHGVGFFLNVHEGPQVFNAANINIPVAANMITSIEPGLYREGKYGIRIENLVRSKVLEENQFGCFMDFETLTLCYIATDLINKSVLEEKHINWLNQYHEMVFERLSPHLDSDTMEWLRIKTQKI